MTISRYEIRKYHWLFLSLYHYLKAETVKEPTITLSLDEYEHLLLQSLANESEPLRRRL